MQSGMTAYVPKPFKPWQLINTIAEVTGRERTTKNNKNEQQYSKPDNTTGDPDVYGQHDQVTNLAYLKKFCDGDEQRMNKYIKVYLNALPAFFKNMDAAIETKDYVELALHIHSFKPKWMMMGMKHTNDLGIKIDQFCKAENDKAFETLTLLLDEVNKSVKELEAKS